jgi:hypothetical protein
MAESQSGTTTVALDENEHAYPRRVMQAVLTVGRKAGYNAGSIDDYTPPAHVELDSNAVITPEWYDGQFTDVMHDKTGVFGEIALETEFDDVFGKNHTGSESTTAVHVRCGHTVAETVAALIENGSIDRAIEKAMTEWQIDAKTAEKRVFFAIAIFAKGWAAEVELTETDAFTKGSVAHDIGGIDAYRGNEHIQIKPVTHGYRHNDDGYSHTVVYYQWDCNGGLVFGTEHTDVNSKAGEHTDKANSLLARECGGRLSDEKELGRAFRYLSW